MMRLDIRERIALFTGICFATILFWYMLLYAPKRIDLKRIKEEQNLIQTQYEQLLENSSSAMLGSAKKLEISKKCMEILDHLPHKKEIASALSQVIETAQGEDIQIVSIIPHKLLFSGNQGNETESQLEKIPIDITLTGRFMDVSQYLFNLVDLPFFAGFSKIGIETSEEIYPETKAQITCILLFLNNVT